MFTRCTATTKKGVPCRAWAVRRSDPPLCIAHIGPSTGRLEPPTNPVSDRQKRSPRETLPPTRSKPSPETVEDTLIEDTLIEDTLIEDTLIEDTLIEDTLIEDIITGLICQQDILSTLIDSALSVPPDVLNLRELARLFAAYGQNASHLGRLLINRCTLLGQNVDARFSLIAKALAEIALEESALLGDSPSPPASAEDAHIEDAPIENAFIKDIISDLARQQAALFALIELCRSASPNAVDSWGLTRLLVVYGQNASRLGRLLICRRTLSGESSDLISSATEQALEELFAEWGVER